MLLSFLIDTAKVVVYVDTCKYLKCFNTTLTQLVLKIYNITHSLTLIVFVVVRYFFFQILFGVIG